MNEMLKNVLYFSSIIIVAEILFNIKKYLNKRCESSKDPPKETAVGLFFPDFSVCCPFVWRDDYHSKQISFRAPERMCKHTDCKFMHFSTETRKPSPFRKLCQLLYSAEKSIDICLWIFSLEFLAKLCVHLKNTKKVSIRIVIDSREDETEKTQISYLKSNGIPVRYAPQMINSGMFHHKFAIVDSSLLLFGSLNWTLSGVRKNMENICVTSRTQLVSPYVQRFEDYWTIFSAEPTNNRRINLFKQN